MKPELQRIFLIMACAILLMTCLWQCNNQVNNAQKQANFVTALYDTLHQTRNAFGQQTTQIDILVGDKKDAQVLLHSKDSTIKHLQRLVNDKTTTATVAGTVTTSAGKTKTQIIYLQDTSTHTDYQLQQRPTYTTHWSTKWDSGNIIATPDSIFRNIKIHNEFEFTQTLQRHGLFSSTPVVTMRNLNPNTSTFELRTYTVQPVPAKRLWWALGGGILAETLHIIFQK